MIEESPTREELLAEIGSLRRQLAQGNIFADAWPQMQPLHKEALRKFLADSMNDILWVMDMDMRITYVSPSVRNVLGYPPPKTPGTSLLPLHRQITPASLDIVNAVMERELAQEKDPHVDPARTVRLELEYFHKDGSTRWMDSVAGGIRNREGVLIGFYGLSRDSTDRKKTQEELQKSREIYALIANNMQDTITVFDMQLRVMFVSPSITRLRGFTPEEVALQPLEKILTPASLAKVAAVLQEELQRVAAGEIVKDRSIILELEEYKKDGAVIWVENRISWLCDENGAPYAILVVARDVTERRQAQEALRQIQELDSSILLSVPHALFGVERRRIFFANEGMEHVFGWKPEELVGKSTRVIFRNDQEWEQYGELLYSRLKEEPLAVFEWDRPFVRKDGKEIYCRMSVSRIGKELTEGRGIVATFEDITQRRLTEQALHESEKKYRHIFENALGGMFLTTIAGRFVTVNYAMTDILGYDSPTDLIESVTDIANQLYVRPAERQILLHDLKQKTDVREFETQFYRKDGNTVWISANLRLVHDDKGEPLYLEGFVIDITQRREIQERLIQAEKMEALGLLAGGVAHDLNNVLGILVGYAELMLHDMENDSRFRKHAQSILSAGERAAAVVQDMLALARRGVHSAEVVDLNHIVQEYLKSAECDRLRLLHPHCRIKTTLDKALLRINGSAAHLLKALANIVLNAAESMPTGGEIVVDTHNRHLDRPLQGYAEVKTGDYVVLSVSDTGQGIPDADRRRIFEPFYTKKVLGQSGTGLGLAVVWGTMKDHDGYIDLHSAPGRGTTMCLYFPVTREELREDAPRAVLSFMGAGETILVVDDAREQRELAAHMLEKLNYRVTTVESGEAAVAYLQTDKPDLVILDMIMDPGMDGLDTYRKMIEIHPGLKAIIVSGYAQTQRVEEAQRLGAGAYVRKPYIMERLGTAIRKALR